MPPITLSADDDRTHVLGVLALELHQGVQPRHAALPAADAGRLAGLVGRDLGALVADASRFDLAFAATHFDPAEVLRSGWPLHRRLDELRLRAPRQQPSLQSGPSSGQAARIIAFNAGAQGEAPLPFQADDDLRGGSLRVLPFLLTGDASAEVRDVAAQLEDILLDRGMAQADTALCAQEAFGTRIEHARYLTVHDLTAMTALQYSHMGLEPLWPIIETALLSPEQVAWLDAPPEPLLRYHAGEANIALFSPDTWRKRYAEGGDDDAEGLERRFDYFQARQRQIAAVLETHGVAVTFVHCTGDATREL